MQVVDHQQQTGWVSMRGGKQIHVASRSLFTAICRVVLRRARWRSGGGGGARGWWSTPSQHCVQTFCTLPNENKQSPCEFTLNGIWSYLTNLDGVKVDPRKSGGTTAPVCAENGIRQPNGGLMFGHRLRRWPNIKPPLVKVILGDSWFCWVWPRACLLYLI